MISCLFIIEWNNELLTKNYNSRPTGTIAFPKANATTFNEYVSILEIKDIFNGWNRDRTCSHGCRRCTQGWDHGGGHRGSCGHNKLGFVMVISITLRKPHLIIKSMGETIKKIKKKEKCHQINHLKIQKIFATYVAWKDIGYVLVIRLNTLLVFIKLHWKKRGWTSFKRNKLDVSFFFLKHSWWKIWRYDYWWRIRIN